MLSTKFGLIFTFSLAYLCLQCACSLYKHHLVDGQNASSKKLVRIKLMKQDDVDPFKTIHENIATIFQQPTGPGEPVIGLSSRLVGLVEIGKPAQEFMLIFDTTYSNMFLPSLNCSNCGPMKRYNSSASSTYLKDGGPVQINQNQGFLSIDQVSFGDYYVIKNQTFIEMLEIANLFVGAPYDGLFCLGFDYSALGEVVPPLKNMFDQKLIDKEMFSIYQSATGGEIVFGSIDESRFVGDIVYTPNVDNIYWAVQVKDVTLVGGESVVCASEEGGCKFLIQTYYSFNRGPPEQVKVINQAMGAIVDEQNESLFVLPECNLSRLTDLELTIGGEKFNLAPEQYVLRMRRADEIICVSSFLASVSPENSNLWIMGGSIVGHIYTVFDYPNKQVGFAKSVKQLSH